MDSKKSLFIFKLKALLFRRRPTLEAGLKETWNLFKRVAGDIPVPGLGAAVEGISFFEEMHDRYETNKEDTKDLDKALRSFLAIVTQEQYQDVKTELSQDDSEIAALVNKFTRIEQDFKGSKTSAVIKGRSIAGEIAGIVKDLEYMIRNIMKKEENEYLENVVPHLQVADSDRAVQGTCYRGTCVRIVNSIEKWLDDEDDGNIFWITGASATGKTTCLMTVLSRVESRSEKDIPFHVIRFHCTRDLPSSDDATLIFSTLAYSLSDGDPQYRKILLNFLKAYLPVIKADSIRSWTPHDQLKKLILDPLHQRTPATMHRVLLVIDGLQECTWKKGGAEDVQNLLAGLIESSGDGSLKRSMLKVLITACPDNIVDTSLLAHTDKLVKRCSMDEWLNSNDCQSDIDRYYRERFNVIRIKDDELCNQNWPPPEDIKRLGRRTAGSFALAKAFCDMVEDASDRAREFENIVGGEDKDLESRLLQIQGPNMGASLMYTSVLKKAFPEHSLNEQSDFRTLVMAIVLIKRLMSPEDFALILTLKKGAVRHLLEGLSPVIASPVRPQFQQFNTATADRSRVVRIRNTSFETFMKDKKLVPDSIYLEPGQLHGTLAWRLLDLLNKKFQPIDHADQFIAKHRNDLGVLEMKVGRAGEVLRVHRAIQYACTFWVDHLSESTYDSKADWPLQVARAMSVFFETGQLLCWIEVLKLSKDSSVDMVPKAVKQAVEWLKKVRPVEKSTVSPDHTPVTPSATVSDVETYERALSLAKTACKHLDKRDFSLGTDVGAYAIPGGAEVNEHRLKDLQANFKATLEILADPGLSNETRLEAFRELLEDETSGLLTKEIRS